MKTYRVTVEVSIGEVLEMVKNRDNPEYKNWFSKDFYCVKSAERYAFDVALHTGKTIKIVPYESFPQGGSLKDRIARRLGVSDQ